MKFLCQRWAIAGFSLATWIGAITTVNLAQAVPSGLKPVPPNACRRSNFYRVKTPDGSGLTVQRKDGTSRSLANGTLMMFLGEGRRGANMLVAGEQEPIVVDSFRSLVAIAANGTFTGKMRLKTLEPGGYVNLRREPTVWGANEKLVVGALQDGTEVNVKGADNTSEFYYVVAPKGLEGYIVSSYLLCSGS